MVDFNATAKHRREVERLVDERRVRTELELEDQGELAQNIGPHLSPSDAAAAKKEVMKELRQVGWGKVMEGNCAS